MSRTKGSKNKKATSAVLTTTENNKKTVVLSKQVVKTEVFELTISKYDIDEMIRKEAKILAGFTETQLFEDYEVKFNKQGDASITMTNPRALIENKVFVKGDNVNEIVKEQFPKSQLATATFIKI